MRLFFFTFVALSLTQCNSHESPELGVGQQSGLAGPTRYFPERATYRPDTPRFTKEGYRLVGRHSYDCRVEFLQAAEVLAAFKEPVLSTALPKHGVYRFIWLRSFARPTLITLAVKANGAGTLTTKFLNKSPGMVVPELINPDEPGLSIKERERRRRFVREMARDSAWLAKVAFAKAPVTVQDTSSRYLTVAQVNGFRQLLNTASFWKAGSYTELGLMDGAYWFLEAAEPNRYGVVFRHSPEQTNPIRRCCEYLLDLSSARQEERY